MCKRSLGPSRQRGMGLIGLILIIGLAAAVGTVILKIGPTYSGFWIVRSLMEDLATGAAVSGGPNGIRSAIDKRMQVNYVEQVSSDDFDIKKIGDRLYRVTLTYENRVHLFFNVDAVTLFNHAVEVRTE